MDTLAALVEAREWEEANHPGWWHNQPGSDLIRKYVAPVTPCGSGQ